MYVSEGLCSVLTRPRPWWESIRWVHVLTCVVAVYFMSMHTLYAWHIHLECILTCMHEYVHTTSYTFAGSSFWRHIHVVCTQPWCRSVQARTWHVQRMAGNMRAVQEAGSVSVILCMYVRMFVCTLTCSKNSGKYARSARGRQRKYVYVCMYVLDWKHLEAHFVYVCMYVCTYGPRCFEWSTYAHTYTHAYTGICPRCLKQLYASNQVHTYVLTFIHTHIHAYIYRNDWKTYKSPRFFQ